MRGVPEAEATASSGVTQNGATSVAWCLLLGRRCRQRMRDAGKTRVAKRLGDDAEAEWGNGEPKLAIRVRNRVRCEKRMCFVFFLLGSKLGSFGIFRLAGVQGTGLAREWRGRCGGIGFVWEMIDRFSVGKWSGKLGSFGLFANFAWACPWRRVGEMRWRECIPTFIVGRSGCKLGLVSY